MGFFDDTIVQDVIRRNIEQVSNLEESQQRKLLRAFRRIRQKLQDRLFAISTERTFTEQQLNVTLVQVQSAIEAIKRELKGEMASAASILSLRGIRDLAREIGRLQKHFEGSIQHLNINAILIAQQSESFLLNKHEASIDAYSEDLRASITSQITSSFMIRDTNHRAVSDLVASVGKFFLGEEWKLNRIVRTEMHGIYNFSKMNAMNSVKESDLPDLKKSLMHPIDDRTGEDSKILAAKNPIVDIDEPFRFTFVSGKKKITRVFMFPPDRPNDRSVLVPFREAWDKKASEFDTQAS